MEAMFQLYRLGNLELTNRFVFPTFQTVILASGMRTAPGPSEYIQKAVPKLEIIGMPTKSRIYSAPYMPVTSWLKDTKCDRQ